MEETELVKRAVRGDAAAFGDLAGRYMNDVYRLARSMGYPRGEAEDLMQDTFLAAFEGIGRYERRASFKTWLLAILFRQAGRARRYQALRKMDVFDENVPGGSNGALKQAAEGGCDRRLDARAMLETLSPEHRAVLVLRELEGMSYDEIAGALEIPRGTVESRLFRARATLRERFQEYSLPKPARPARPVEPSGGRP